MLTLEPGLPAARLEPEHKKACFFLRAAVLSSMQSKFRGVPVPGRHVHERPEHHYANQGWPEACASRGSAIFREPRGTTPGGSFGAQRGLFFLFLAFCGLGGLPLNRRNSVWEFWALQDLGKSPTAEAPLCQTPRSWQQEWRPCPATWGSGEQLAMTPGLHIMVTSLYSLHCLNRQRGPSGVQRDFPSRTFGSCSKLKNTDDLLATSAGTSAGDMGWAFNMDEVGLGTGPWTLGLTSVRTTVFCFTLLL